MYAAQFSNLPPLGLYIHMPWCEHKCPYCDFNSHVIEQIPEQAYIDALLNDLAQELPYVWGRKVETVFIGGGTPSLFSGAAIQSLMQGLRAYLNLDPRCEITLESNPGSAEQSRYAAYREAGINRLSIGAQSFNGQHLRSLERVHNREQAINAAQMAQMAGFDNFNLDLMFALPGQSLNEAREDIEQALALQPQHLSYYQLTLEPNTRFGKYPPNLPDEDTAWDMLDAGQTLLHQAGFHQYEVSAYSQAGRQAQHNLNYWQFGDYLGIGAGAHGKISFPDGRIVRRVKHWQPERYLKGEFLSQEQSLDQDQRIFDFMLNSTRLKDGFELNTFEKHTGLPRAALQQALRLAKEKELIKVNKDKINPTELGWRFLNDLQQLFLHPNGEKSRAITVSLD